MTKPKHFRVTAPYIVDREQNEGNGEVGRDHFRRQPRDEVVQRLACFRIEEFFCGTVAAAAAASTPDPENPGTNDSTPLAGGDGDERQRGEEDVIAGIKSVPQRRDGVSQVEIPR